MDGFNIPKRRSEWNRLRRIMSARHHIVLDGFLKEETHAKLLEKLKKADFKLYLNSSFGKEWTCADPAIRRALKFFLTDTSVLEFVRFLSNVDSLDHIDGRIYRLDSQAATGFRWHGDLHGTRRVGLSINLGLQSFKGGEFEIRSLKPKAHTLGQVANLGRGSALLFRIDPKLQHRVHPLTGKVAKMCYAGWFCD